MDDALAPSRVAALVGLTLFGLVAVHLLVASDTHDGAPRRLDLARMSLLGVACVAIPSLMYCLSNVMSLNQRGLNHWSHRHP